MMNRVMVILTLDMDNLPENFQEILQHEREVVASWKAEGILDQLFLRESRNGAVLIFKDISEEQVHTLLPTLPFYALRKSIEVYPLIADMV